MLALYRQAEFPAGIAYALNEMADIVHREGNSAQAIAYREEASAIARTLPYKGFLLQLLWKQGQQALIEARPGVRAPCWRNGMRRRRILPAVRHLTPHTD